MDNATTNRIQQLRAMVSAERSKTTELQNGVTDSEQKIKLGLLLKWLDDAESLLNSERVDHAQQCLDLALVERRQVGETVAKYGTDTESPDTQ
jgi:hypothetical protein